MQQHPLATRFIAEIELLAHKHQCLLWAMDNTFSKELFITSTFKDLVKHDVWEMYQNQSIADFEKNFNAITQDDCFDELRNRLINPEYTVIYEFKLPDGGTQLVQDRSFHLNDAEGNCLLIAGVAVNINQDDYSEERQKIISDQIDKITIEYYRLLMLPFTLNPQVEELNVEELTEKQNIIFKYILHGYTAKEIAKKLNLSFRTVESHTNAIKKVFNANSKSELITIAISKNHLAIRLEI